MTILITIEGREYTIENDGVSFMPSYTSQNKGNKGDKDKDVTRQLGHFSSLGSAVNRLIREALGTEESTITLRQYVERYEKAVQEVKGIIKDDLSEL